MFRSWIVLLVPCLLVGVASCDLFLDEDPACVPECAERLCGPDPRCGESCGSCGSRMVCNTEGRCVPLQDGEEPTGADDGDPGPPDGGDPDGADDAADAGDDASDPGADEGGDPGADGDPGSCEGLEIECRVPQSQTMVSQGPDLDSDDWGLCCDCDDGDPEIHPYRRENTADGVDNDCNGLVDEPGGLMVPVAFYDDQVWIDVYEVGVFDNPDCTGTQYGVTADDYPAGFPADGTAPTVILYACSLPGIMPSGYLSWYRARHACEAQGKRLCSEFEWGVACSGGTNEYPYGLAFEPGVCNDAIGGLGEPAPTGSRPECLSEDGTYDQSGNLHEWARTWSAYSEGAALAGGWTYLCEICTDHSTHMTCAPCVLPRDLPQFEDIHDCVIHDGDITRHPRHVVRRWMGTRCCREGP
jgi:hypothetical protein